MNAVLEKSHQCSQTNGANSLFISSPTHPNPPTAHPSLMYTSPSEETPHIPRPMRFGATWMRYSPLGDAVVRCMWGNIKSPNHSPTSAPTPRTHGVRALQPIADLPFSPPSPKPSETTAEPNAPNIWRNQPLAFDRPTSALYAEAERALCDNRQCLEQVMDIIVEVQDAKRVETSLTASLEALGSDAPPTRPASSLAKSLPPKRLSKTDIQNEVNTQTRLDSAENHMPCVTEERNSPPFSVLRQNTSPTTHSQPDTSSLAAMRTVYHSQPDHFPQVTSTTQTSSADPTLPPTGVVLPQLPASPRSPRAVRFSPLRKSLVALPDHLLPDMSYAAAAPTRHALKTTPALPPLCNTNRSADVRPDWVEEDCAEVDFAAPVMSTKVEEKVCAGDGRPLRGDGFHALVEETLQAERRGLEEWKGALDGVREVRRSLSLQTPERQTQ